VSYDIYLEQPNPVDCCEAEDCVEADEEGNIECKCDDHECSSCGGQCACRCDSDYEAWKDSQF